MLPIKTGNQIVRELRSSEKFGRIPIIIVSGKTAEEDKVRALQLGADDYITKPFSPNEMIARIQAVFRRANRLSEDRSCIEHKNLKVDLRAGRVTSSGKELPLTLTEFKILVELVSQRGRVLSREHLRDSVIGKEQITDRTVDVHVAGLRKKMGDAGRDIRTVRGVGYRFAE
ncbi:MAG: response regulator transcription factor [Bdellovibrionales bacterium]|nr:response regulator transcription factor [Bdellovibrionales bacterium]